MTRIVQSSARDSTGGRDYLARHTTATHSVPIFIPQTRCHRGEGPMMVAESGKILDEGQKNLRPDIESLVVDGEHAKQCLSQRPI